MNTTSEDRHLRWRCRRGMLELDVMLTRFLEGRYPKLPAPEQASFRQLLETEDDQLWDWLSGRAAPPPDLETICAAIRQPV
ncbi:MAG: succinate dehydrogenase assembly factor 2 [Pseudomonadota bacterium]